MTILFLTRLFYPHIGGVEKHVFEISKILIEKGHKVIVVAEKHQKNLKSKDKVHDIEIHRIPVGESMWFKKFSIWWWLWNHKQLIKNVNIIHCHDVFFWYLPFRFLFIRKPIYTTFHGYESYPISKKAIIMHKVSEILSWGNICIGDYIKKWYGTKPTLVSYGGVDVEKFSPRGEAGKVQSSKFKVKEKSSVFIGRLDEQTGILTYIEAIKLIRKKIPDFKFVVAGDGKYRKEVEKYTKVLGFKKNPERYFTKYHFAFVSRYLTILEALASRRLVFAIYNNPLKKDYLIHAPFANFIVVVENPRLLAKSVVYYLSHPQEEKEKVEKGYAWVKKQAWDNVTSLYLSLWKNKM